MQTKKKASSSAPFHRTRQALVTKLIKLIQKRTDRLQKRRQTKEGASPSASFAHNGTGSKVEKTPHKKGGDSFARTQVGGPKPQRSLREGREGANGTGGIEHATPSVCPCHFLHYGPEGSCKPSGSHRATRLSGITANRNGSPLKIRRTLPDLPRRTYWLPRPVETRLLSPASQKVALAPSKSTHLPVSSYLRSRRFRAHGMIQAGDNRRTSKSRMPCI